MGLRDLLSADQKCFEKEFSLQKNVGLMFSTLNLQFKTKHKKIAFRNLTEVAFQQVFDFLYPLNLKCVIAVLWMFIHRRPVKNRISLSELWFHTLFHFHNIYVNYENYYQQFTANLSALSIMWSEWDCIFMTQAILEYNNGTTMNKNFHWTIVYS